MNGLFIVKNAKAAGAKIVLVYIVTAYNYQPAGAILFNKRMVQTIARCIKIGAGLIKQHNGYIRKNGLRQLNTLLHTAAVIAYLLISGGGQLNLA